MAGHGIKSECTICFEPYSYKDDHSMCSTQCGHVFGRSCLLKWFGNQREANCPRCRLACERHLLRIIFADDMLTSSECAKDLSLEGSSILHAQKEKLEAKISQLTEHVKFLTINSSAITQIIARFIAFASNSILNMTKIRDMYLYPTCAASKVLYSPVRQRYCISWIQDGYVGVLVIGKGCRKSRFIGVCEARIEPDIADIAISCNGNLVAIAYRNTYYMIEVDLQDCMVDTRPMPNAICALSFDYGTEETVLICLVNGMIFRKKIGYPARLCFRYNSRAFGISAISSNEVLLTRERDISVIKCEFHDTPVPGPVFDTTSGVCFPALLRSEFKALKIEDYTHYLCNLNYFGIDEDSKLKIYNNLIIFSSMNYYLHVFVNYEGTEVALIRTIITGSRIVDFNYSTNGIFILTAESALLYR